MSLYWGGGGGGGCSVIMGTDNNLLLIFQLALDLAEPGPLLSDLIPILKPSGLVAVYLPK